MEQMEQVVERVAALPGVVAVVLGGSRARGVEHADSDTDLGLFYSDAHPLDIEAVRGLAGELDPGNTSVTGLYEWGPWVNGGAWLDIDGLGRVDLIYRSVEHVERTLRELHDGHREHHWHQQAPFGFTSVIYGGEVDCCVPLHDPGSAIPRLKALTAEYPDALRRHIVASDLNGAEFAVGVARKQAPRNDPVYVMACLTRVVSLLTQVLFALERVWFVNDKRAVDAIANFACAPASISQSINSIISGVHGPIERVEMTATVIAEVVRAAGDLYVSRW